MKNLRVAKLMAALRKRFPGATLITGPMPDAPTSGEIRIRVLNAPMSPPNVVHDFAWKLIDAMWDVDEPLPALVSPVGPEESAKYYSHLLAKPPQARRRRRAPTSRKRTRAVAGRA